MADRQKSGSSKTATKKRPSTKTSGTSAKAKNGSGGSSGKSAPAKNPVISPRRPIVGLALLVVGIFQLLSLFWETTGFVGKWLKSAAIGVFGSGAYILPVAFVITGILFFGRYEGRGRAVRVASITGLIVVAVAFIHLFALPVEGAGFEYVTELWWSGWNGTSGGVLGGLICALLRRLTGEIGATLILAVLAIALGIASSGVTVDDLIDAVKLKREERAAAKDYAGEQADKPPKEEDVSEPSFFGIPIKRDTGFAPPKKKKLFNIDLPVEETAEFGDMRPDGGEEADPPPWDTGAPSATADTVSSDTDHIDEIIKKRIPDGPEPAVDDQPTPLEITRSEIVAEERLVEKMIEEEPEPKPYEFPPLSLLGRSGASVAANTAEMRATAEKIVSTLRSFGVESKITDIVGGPSVTRYELQPSAGVKISKITGLSDDIAMNLAAEGVRIEAPIPGKAAIGIEVPNKELSVVRLRDIIESAEFRNPKNQISFPLGRDIGGNPIVGDIANMPHVLIAGATGSGKSVCINSLLTGILYRYKPEELRIIMVDPKVVELIGYNGIPHLLVPVVTETKSVAGVLSWAVGEMNKRYKLFAENKVRDLKGYNNAAAQNDELEPLYRILIVIDELADLMMVSPREVEDSIARLAQMARAAGMHLVIATQRPSVDVITGTIKSNIPSRIAFAVSSQVDSRTILDMGGAEKLLGKGDMLYYPVGAAKPHRLQGCFVTDEEVEQVVGFVKRMSEVEYSEEVIKGIDEEIQRKASKGGEAGEEGEDEMFWDAVEAVVEAGSASTSFLQRRLKVGYARAGRLVDDMEERGIVGPYEGSKPRSVLISKLQWQEMKMRRYESDNSVLTE